MKPIPPAHPAAWILFAVLASSAALLWGAYTATGGTQLGILGGASTTSILAGINLSAILLCRYVSRGQRAIQTDVHTRIEEAYWRGYEHGVTDQTPHQNLIPVE